MRTYLRWCAFWMCLTTVPAFAETRVALVVANADYGQAALSNPTVDAELVRKALVAISFDVVVVENASLEQFDSAVVAFAAKARGADLALFYYAGHGFALTERGVARNYLMSTDADVTSKSERVLRAAGMPLDDLIAELSEQAKTTIVFIDACRNDPRVSRAGGGRGRSAVPIINTFGESVFVGLSTRAGDVAEDGEPGLGSPFARAFAANIGIAGERLDDVFTDIRLDVEEATGRRQRPDVGRYDLVAPVVLNPTPPASALTTVPPSSLQSDPCRDATAHWTAVNMRGNKVLIEEHLQLFPSCAFATLARLMLDEIRSPTNAPETECDRLAANNRDEGRLLSVTGVPFERVDAKLAVPACQAALKSYPKVPRLVYQLGRAFLREKNYNQAVQLFRQASELGYTAAMNGIGTRYRRGEGVPQDYALAREWFEKAAVLGNSDAITSLGILYENGQGVPQDYTKARELYEKAAALGNSGAMNQLTLLYAEGRGVAQNYAKAREWSERGPPRSATWTR
jgi:uncharacterized protein